MCLKMFSETTVTNVLRNLLLSQSPSHLFPEMISFRLFNRPFDVRIYANQSFHATRDLDVARQRFQQHGNDEISSSLDAFPLGDLQFKLTPWTLQEVPAEYDDSFSCWIRSISIYSPRSGHLERNHVHECRVGNEAGPQCPHLLVFYRDSFEVHSKPSPDHRYGTTRMRHIHNFLRTLQSLDKLSC